jgi:hypothetical protein
MARLKKYSNFKALKLDTASGETNLIDSDERHLAFEKFINILQTELGKKQSDNANKLTKKDS